MTEISGIPAYNPYYGNTPLMKLDKDLVREILLAIEAYAEPEGLIVLEIDDRPSEEVSYHVRLLDEAGLLAALNTGGMDRFRWQPQRLTYKGHEFLDTIRDGEVWRRTKAGAEKAGVAGLGVLLELGKAYGKEVLKEKRKRPANTHCIARWRCHICGSCSLNTRVPDDRVELRLLIWSLKENLCTHELSCSI
ncbi:MULTISPECIES: DUF2513 domain-containing protein [Pseudomonas]|uniref:DUF2513 domain-containing protein n=10 Tax=Pseudomonas syringae group TaxID=136849 RepID=A0A2K4WS64_PSESX|nr:MULTISPECIES: DUF2513 domain-containing protein [Pseudomonas]KPX27187.1 Uncharacterized protein ALO70_01159 [Pseudomonas amygdali pv. eriobotryae]KPX97726.1 Uncharacterized protein ALO61_01739 [Pseudomonas savastanoi pv. nerii]MCQ3023915.1 DUF2513 domain-containing protein [Pseudomonas savastanoi]MDT3224349.1 DUF2513 domain-containing protein [Pseudomonas amygdali pv. morsprunorum]MDT3267004.1 DUF2513 domain-containing protein [Pseudomonas amygdali pv. morsprunorum]